MGVILYSLHKTKARPLRNSGFEPDFQKPTLQTMQQKNCSQALSTAWDTILKLSEPNTQSLTMYRSLIVERILALAAPTPLDLSFICKLTSLSHAVNISSIPFQRVQEVISKTPNLISLSHTPMHRLLQVLVLAWIFEMETIEG